MKNDFFDAEYIIAQLDQRSNKGSTQALAADLITVVAKHIAQRCQHEKGNAEYQLLMQSADIYQLEHKLAAQAEQIADLQRRLP